MDILRAVPPMPNREVLARDGCFCEIAIFASPIDPSALFARAGTALGTRHCERQMVISPRLGIYRFLALAVRPFRGTGLNSPVQVPLDRERELLAHHDAGCWMYSTVGWFDGHPVFFS